MIFTPNATYGKARTRAELHFTGGFRGFQQPEGWVIAPMLIDENLRAVGPFQLEEIRGIARELDVSILGINELSIMENQPEYQVWMDISALGEGQGPSAADLWSSISANARRASEADYADLASNIAASLRAADIRIRDASHQYHIQLIPALQRKQIAGRRFTNLAMADLFLAFHSLLVELCAARDYLAAIVARHLGAGANVDSMAKLDGWTKRTANADTKDDVLVRELMEDYKEQRWLAELTEYRNRVLHREPMGAGGIKRGAMLVELNTRMGSVQKLYLAIPAAFDADRTVDALGHLSSLHQKMQSLAKRISMHALFPGKPIDVVVQR
ncbi:MULTISPECIES: hypothetical protein [unclassified Paraburkholderia]|uniref:hypothetical protein n=1 Tax=unclassified Paraburkholderia TaxID=2615204 RepID=UPI002AAF8972|nr:MULTISPECIES: hypothetical protein [unclassified Paraburkholderia]